MDTSSMTAGELQSYQQTVQLLTELQQAAERLGANDLPSDQRQELRGAVRQDMQALQPLLQAQRNIEWYSLGLQLGYNQQDALAFADNLNLIADQTSMRNVYQNVRSGMPPNMSGLASPSR